MCCCCRVSSFTLASTGICQKRNDTKNSVVGVLMEFLNGDGAMDVILFVRSIVEQYEVGELLLPSILHVILMTSVPPSLLLDVSIRIPVDYYISISIVIASVRDFVDYT